MGRAKDAINQRYSTVNERMLKDVALNHDQPYVAAKKFCTGLRERAKIKQSKQEKWRSTEGK